MFDEKWATGNVNHSLFLVKVKSLVFYLSNVKSILNDSHHLFALKRVQEKKEHALFNISNTPGRRQMLIVWVEMVNYNFLLKVSSYVMCLIYTLTFY